MHLSMLAVAPECWGQGIGRALLRACVDRVTMLGYRAVALWTHESNERAHRLYARIGFKRGDRVKTDEDGQPIRLHVLSLESAAFGPSTSP
jgi:ribosomal protein S18 acetylase RimI-like enzyme